MNANIFNNSELSAVKMVRNNLHQIYLRTPWVIGAIIGAKQDNKVFVKEKWSKSNENSNIFKTCC